MSTDYDLHCKTCKKTLEIVASGSIAYGDKLWRHQAGLDALSDFLFSHRGHNLVFDDSQIIEDLIGGDDEPAKSPSASPQQEAR